MSINFFGSSTAVRAKNLKDVQHKQHVSLFVGALELGDANPLISSLRTWTYKLNPKPETKKP